MRAACGDQVGVGHIGRRDDVRDRNLAQPVVGYPDDRGLGDTRDHLQHLLDVLGKDLVAAAVDDVAGPAFYPHETLVVDARQVAGVDVSVFVDP